MFLDPHREVSIPCRARCYHIECEGGKNTLVLFYFESKVMFILLPTQHESSQRTYEYLMHSYFIIATKKHVKGIL
jgi:hypothetical protein